jgi:N-acetylglucosaminyldiphosphoundecaprenol N-acetyl-beta-D-mannosaminyltransferase
MVRISVLGSPINAIDRSTCLQQVVRWAKAGESRYLCFCNVHSVVSATEDERLAEAIAGADMSLPDGAPVAWSLRHFGAASQERVSGPDTTWDLCRLAELHGLPVFFLGSTEDTLHALCATVSAAFPGLVIAGSYAPPFRPVSADEDAMMVANLNDSGASIFFIGLGCPKQEVWMREHRGRVRGVMLGVGAAFDFHSGMKARAPKWMRSHGLEWLHRLFREPSRLAGRYLVTNTVFVVKMAASLIAFRLMGGTRRSGNGGV